MNRRALGNSGRDRRVDARSQLHVGRDRPTLPILVTAQQRGLGSLDVVQQDEGGMGTSSADAARSTTRTRTSWNSSSGTISSPSAMLSVPMKSGAVDADRHIEHRFVVRLAARIYPRVWVPPIDKVVADSATRRLDRGLMEETRQEKPGGGVGSGARTELRPIERREERACSIDVGKHDDVLVEERRGDNVFPHAHVVRRRCHEIEDRCHERATLVDTASDFGIEAHRLRCGVGEPRLSRTRSSGAASHERCADPVGSSWERSCWAR